jgi:DNA-binding PadR family transcriptional regulator
VASDFSRKDLHRYYAVRNTFRVVAAKKRPSLQDLGRFSEPALLILVSLADGPKHGYAMIKDIERVAGQTLGPGTLYGAITRLEAEKWIEPLPADDRRRPYQLTSAGAAVLRARLEALSAVTRVGRARLVDA